MHNILKASVGTVVVFSSLPVCFAVSSPLPPQHSHIIALLQFSRDSFRTTSTHFCLPSNSWGRRVRRDQLGRHMRVFLLWSFPKPGGGNLKSSPTYYCSTFIIQNVTTDTSFLRFRRTKMPFTNPFIARLYFLSLICRSLETKIVSVGLQNYILDFFIETWPSSQEQHILY